MGERTKSKGASGQLSLRTGREPHLVGELHGFRHPVEDWPKLVAAVRDLGCTHVAALAPFSEHEPRPGEFELGGLRASLDLGRFLDVVRDAGLRAVVRLGPRLRADLSYAGLPEHVVWDRASMARSARGNPVLSPMPPRMFPWPSYASAAYRAHVTRFFEHMAPTLAPRLAPTGIVDAVEVEDAASVLLRAGAYARDYHPESVARFRDYLRELYESADALSSAWGVRVARFEDVEPPTRFTAGSTRDLPRHLDWARYQEHCVARHRAFLCDELDRLGLDAAVSSTLDASALGTPTDPSSADARLDRVGIELTTRGDEVMAVRRRVSPIALASGRPFARVVLGGSPFGRARSDRDAVGTLLHACAFGARELELSPVVTHERSWGAPIAQDASGSPLRDELALVTAALRGLELQTLPYRPEVLLALPPEYTRLARATHLFGPFGAGILDFVGRSFAEATFSGAAGFERAIPAAYFDRVAALEASLDRAALDWAHVDPRSLSRLDYAPKAVFAPTFDFLDDDTAEALVAIAERGASVHIGPSMPTLDGKMFSRPPLPFACAPEDGAELDAAVEALALELGLSRLPTDANGGVRALPMRDARRTVAYVASNPTDAASALVFEQVDVVDAITGDRFESGADVPVDRGSARLLLVSEAPKRRTRPPAARARRPS